MTRRPAARLLPLLAPALAALAGCPDRTIAEVHPSQGRVESKDIPVAANRDIDILFLIDDSSSMKDKQDNLASNFPQFIDVLATIQGGLPNVHIGITTSDMGTSATNGVGATNGGCTGTGRAGKLQVLGAPGVTGKFLSDTVSASDPLTRTRNYTGDLATTFATMATAVGTVGCGFEQHLEAIKTALDPAGPAASFNAGFIRPSALLAIIIIADEDDCSLSDNALIEGADESPLGPLVSFRCTRYGVTCDVGGATPDEMNVVGTKTQCHSNETGDHLTKVSGYVDFVKGLKADPKSVIVALVGGPAVPVATEKRTDAQHATPIPALAHACEYTGASGKEVADPSVRQSEFINAFPNRGTTTTICDSDLTGGLAQIAQLIKDASGNACMTGTPVVPYDCSVSTVENPGASQVETILHECMDETDTDLSPNAPCWALVADAAQCATSPGDLKLRVKRNGVAPADGTHILANCVTAVTDGSGSNQ